MSTSSRDHCNAVSMNGFVCCKFCCAAQCISQHDLLDIRIVAPTAHIPSLSLILIRPGTPCTTVSLGLPSFNFSLVGLVLVAAILIPAFYFLTVKPPTPNRAEMSKLLGKSKSGSKVSEDQIAQFCGVTGASVKDAKKFLEKYKRLDVAIDAYYNDPNALAATAASKSSAGASPTKLNALFDTYKDPDSDEITVDGTIRLCSDLGVDPEDVMLLAVAYELKSTSVGSWNRQGWVDGWKSLNCDSIPAMKAACGRLNHRLGSEYQYFQKVYNYTFEFARTEGARSLAVDTAIAFWSLLLPHGLKGGALEHVLPDDDDAMQTDSNEEGWQPQYTDWWFEYLTEKGGKGVSKDTWVMLLDFIRTIDSKFAKYDIEAAWPSAIDDFVEWAKTRL